MIQKYFPDIYSNHLKSFSKTYSQLLWENFDHVCHSYIANKELGIKYKLTPNELRKVFKWGVNFYSKPQINDQKL